MVAQRHSDQAVIVVVRKGGKEAGLAPFSPHDLRRSFILDLLNVGVDLSAVRGLIGHASVVTTAGYDRRGEVAKQKAVAGLVVPFGVS